MKLTAIAFATATIVLVPANTFAFAQGAPSGRGSAWATTPRNQSPALSGMERTGPVALRCATRANSGRRLYKHWHDFPGKHAHLLLERQ